MLLVQLKRADVTCGKATLRTSPSSGQATISFQLRHPKLLACHSGPALGIRKPVWPCSSKLYSCLHAFTGKRESFAVALTYFL